MRLFPPPRAALPILLACSLSCCLSCSGGGTAAPDRTGPAASSAGTGGTDVGAPGVGDRLFPGAGNGGYDVTHYGLDLAYDPGSGKLRGTAVVTVTATQPLARFNLDLSGFTVTRVTVDGRTAAVDRDGTEMRVRPVTPLRDGARFETTVTYEGVPPTLTDPDGSHEGWFRTDDGALALGEPVGAMAWFPSNNHPSDKAAYDITVTVPHGLTAVSNGELVDSESASGRTAFHWRSKEPMATYLATVAIGHFDITRSRTGGGVPVYVAVDPRSDDPTTAAALRRIPEIVDWESGLFGPYPFSSVGAIVDHLPSGRVGYALEAQTKPVFPGDGEPGDPAVPLDTLVHELSHQWFGDSVTPAAWQDMWLNEGFATYTEWLWQEHEGGRTVEQSAAAALADPANSAFPPAAPPGPDRISDAPVYGGGALVLYQLRETLGPTVFATLLRTWPAARRHGNATTADFTAFCQHLTPHNLTPLFTAWLHTTHHPSVP
ncbi:M1 family metallopeptidase [Streptomyces sp. CBMA29]|uniref:M1 family metallopeptidase n=1 Tax=Streptomyces sp. CBMA29 TaxID=1896314 RepID=UPI002948BAC4|nr:M1 family metallopeptidase [Streptomyces sp. CBMA29]